MKITHKSVTATRNATTPHYISTHNNARHSGYTIYAPHGGDADTVTLVCRCNHQRQHVTECLHRQAARALLRAEAKVEAESLDVCGDAYRDGDDLLFAL